MEKHGCGFKTGTKGCFYEDFSDSGQIDARESSVNPGTQFIVTG